MQANPLKFWLDDVTGGDASHGSIRLPAAAAPPAAATPAGRVAPIAPVAAVPVAFAVPGAAAVTAVPLASRLFFSTTELWDDFKSWKLRFSPHTNLEHKAFSNKLCVLASQRSRAEIEHARMNRGAGSERGYYLRRTA